MQSDKLFANRLIWEYFFIIFWIIILFRTSLTNQFQVKCLFPKGELWNMYFCWVLL
jgi:hypothetical protein